ncbi:hypothetical protein CCR75_003685 [Bremia lactucae]|uniref:Protein SMG9 n=1 Tax=Bremia lactucae TaxID=4779 RepID=A0A976NYZ9_BRELC|nr:hypothetical protein CCR75_003685 [Bremia lactucae]
MQRSSTNRRIGSSSTAQGVSSRAGTSSVSNLTRVSRSRGRAVGASGPLSSAAMTKTPSILLRPLSGGTLGSTGVLYEPDAHKRSSLYVSDRESHNNTRSKTLDRHNDNDTSSVFLRPHHPSSVQQTKTVPPLTRVKLITPQMQFATDLSIKLGSCLELENFTVVGVLGLEGVGKSTILSLLQEKKASEKEVDLTQRVEALALDRYGTTGVDLAISLIGGAGHPTVLLDSQPLLSSSMLVDLLDRNDAHRYGALSPDQQVEIVSYQLAVFLCAICHYVVLVHDDLAYQVSVNELLRIIDLKMTQCRLPSVTGNNHRHAAQLLYVANNMADSELLYRENELLSAHERALEAAWSQALVRVPHKVSSYSSSADTDKYVQNVAYFVFPCQQQQSIRKDIKTHVQLSSASPTSGHKIEIDRNTKRRSSKYSEFDEVAEDFRRFVLSLPSSPSFTFPVTVKNAASKTLPHALTLREWLSNASRVFEALRKASCFTAEYASSRDHQ